MPNRDWNNRGWRDEGRDNDDDRERSFGRDDEGFRYGRDRDRDDRRSFGTGGGSRGGATHFSRGEWGGVLGRDDDRDRGGRVEGPRDLAYGRDDGRDFDARAFARAYGAGDNRDRSDDRRGWEDDRGWRSSGDRGMDRPRGDYVRRDEGVRDRGFYRMGRDWDERDREIAYGLRSEGGRDRDEYRGRERDHDDRGFFKKMKDKIVGRPPRNYRRSDERIREDIYDRLLTGWVDADDVTVEVKDGEVTLTGTIPSRDEKRAIEDLSEDVLGVKDVHNHLKVRREVSEAQTRGETVQGQGAAGTTQTQQTVTGATPGTLPGGQTSTQAQRGPSGRA